jgi:hypothetical protein
VPRVVCLDAVRRGSLVWSAWAASRVRRAALLVQADDGGQFLPFLSSPCLASTMQCLLMALAHAVTSFVLVSRTNVRLLLPCLKRPSPVFLSRTSYTHLDSHSPPHCQEVGCRSLVIVSLRPASSTGMEVSLSLSLSSLSSSSLLRSVVPPWALGLTDRG